MLTRRGGGRALVAGLLLACLAASCRSDERAALRRVVPPVVAVANTDQGAAVRFTEVAAGAGIDYVQHPASVPPNCVTFGGRTEGLLSCMEERMSGGAVAADFDGDGRPDLFVTRLGASNILYRNDGDGTFSDATAGSGLEGPQKSNGAGAADIDNDGDQDLYVTTISDRRFYLFVNDGHGHFTEEADARGLALEDDEPHSGFSVAFGDYDADGFIDIHTTEWLAPWRLTSDPPEHARLFRNRGKGRPGYFKDTTKAARVELELGIKDSQGMAEQGKRPVFSFGSTFADLDGDALADLVVAGDFGTSQVFWNDGNAKFSDGTAKTPFHDVGNAMGTTFGDYDGDGDLDWFVSAIQNRDANCRGRPCDDPTYTGNRLYRNEGHRKFTDVTDAAGVLDGFWGWGAAFFDYDNDGRLDLVETNGQDFGPSQEQLAADAYKNTPMRLWHNEGDGTFTEQSGPAGLATKGAGKGLLVFDYDSDGDVDVFVVNNAGHPALYRNDGGSTASWLRLAVRGKGSNRDALGAIVTVRATPGGPTQRREVGVATHFLGQSETTLHFGLGTWKAPVDRVEVFWPRTGRRQVLRNVAPGRTRLVVEPTA